MQNLVYNPGRFGPRMTIVCWVSGSGTNYREIVRRNPHHNYVVFTNRPGCGGEDIAKGNRHPVIELSHIPFLKGTRERYGAGAVPRNCPERVAFEQEASRLIEAQIGRQPDLICLAGYDQWLTDWTVDRYYPRILNVHPGDTTKGYDGLHWVPSAKALLRRDSAIRSTLFFVNKGEDTGPVLVQSAPLYIVKTLSALDMQNGSRLLAALEEVLAFAGTEHVTSYEEFRSKAGEGLNRQLAAVCGALQDALKVAGDWQIYPYAVHDLIAPGRVAVENSHIYVDGTALPIYGVRLR